MKSAKALAIVAAATGITLTITAAPAGAGTPNHSPRQLHVIKTLSSGTYIGPLQFAVEGKKVLVADSFTSTINQIGRTQPIATGPAPATGGDVGGVAVDPATGAIAYTSSVGPVDGEGNHTAASLTVLRHGAKPLVVDLFKFESKHNPDGRVTYGLTSLPTDPVRLACVQGALGPIAQYKGQVDTHPYAVTSLGHGAWAIADAGGNDVLKVDRWGHVSVLSVLPPQPVKITTAIATAGGLPACLVGLTYRFEPVPTDVETTPDGRLDVSILSATFEIGVPGGAVYQLDRWGHSHRIAAGFVSATNLAVDPRGHVYVADLFGGQILQVVHGVGVKVATLPGAAAVEWANGHLYASTSPAAAASDDPNAPPPGPAQVVILG
jgi:hypothetical protein